MLEGAVFPDQTVTERFAVAAGLSKLDMIPDFLRYGSWILTKLPTDTFKRFLFHQPPLNEDSILLG